MTGFTMTIDGEGVGGSEWFRVINPALEEPFDYAPDCSRDELDLAMESAASAFDGWRRDEEARRNGLLAAAAEVEHAVDELSRLLTDEQGKPLHAARQEVLSVAACLRWFGTLRVEPETVPDEHAVVQVFRRPLGVVAAITPWNYPLILASYKVAPALLAGNTVVLKPSPFTPLSTLRMGELLRTVVPPGVLNVVSGGDELGRWMTEHPTPRKVSFTGSVPTGKRVAVACGSDLKRCTLELGGNDPAIVLDDVEVSTMVDRLFWGAFTNTGQICAAIKRLYVPERLYEEVVEALAEKARSVTVGDGADEGTELGPINNRPQFERVCDLVDDALRAGGRAAVGGGPLDRPGYFFAPTILTDVSEGVRVVDEEQFGPALPVMPYRDVHDAVVRSNATQYGLSASVWGSDVARAAEVASEIEAGTVWLNAHLVFGPHLPFAGAKWSGIGVENGTLGYHEFTSLQVIHRARDH